MRSLENPWPRTFLQGCVTQSHGGPVVREWIIFAICLGLGGHIALGVVLHAPDLWPWKYAALYGLLTGFAMYAVVQMSRSLWWFLRGRHQKVAPSRKLL